MTIKSSAWERFIESLAKVDVAATAAVREYLVTNGLPSTQASVDDLVTFAFSQSTKYGEAAATLAAEMYDYIAISAGKSLVSAEPAAVATRSEVAKAVVGTLDSGNEDLISSAVGRLVKQAGVDTTMKNAIRDGAQWAWVPHGDTCAFCMTLASRGWQNSSAKALKDGHATHIHANCDCTYAVRFDSGSGVEGYDPDEYLRRYRDFDGDINAMRRADYAERKDDINAQKRAAYAKRVERTEKG